MELSKKDITNIAGSRFDTKFYRSIWCWLGIALLFICFLYFNYYDKNIKADQTVVGFISNSGEIITYSGNYGDILEQYVFNGNTIANYGKYITLNGMRYDITGVDKYETNNGFWGYLYEYRRYISITLLVLFALLGYFKYYKPRSKYIKQLVDEYEKEHNK